MVIDDKDEEGRPLINALVSAGHLATFLAPLPEHMPQSPLTGIRVVFLDLILATEYQPQQNIISTILGVMNSVIDKQQNGPFFLVCWTNRPEEAEGVVDALRGNGFPLVAAMMEKQECMDEGGKFSIPLIEEKMDAALAGGATLQMFTLWENHVHLAAGKIVNRFSSLGIPANGRDEQTELVVAKLAKSVLGKHFDPKRLGNAIESAMYALNTVLVGATHQETHDSPESAKINMRLPSIPDESPAELVDGKINSMLLLKTTTGRSPMPGNVYKNCVGDIDPLDLVDGLSDPDKNSLKKEVKHIMLEVTPVCDYAEKKSLRNRILPGVVFPNKHHKRLKRKAEFLTISPVLAGEDGGLFRFVFDFRRFTSVESGQMPSDEPVFALQNDLLADIQTKLSRHVSRLGVASV